MRRFTITDEQLARYHADGFFIVEKLLSDEEIELLGDPRRFPAFADARAGDNQCRDTRAAGACDDRLEVVAKARVRKIGADVNHCRAEVRAPCGSSGP